MFRKLTITSALLLCIISVNAQSEYHLDEVEGANKVILSHYTKEQLKEMRQLYPEKYTTVQYYYTSSFQLEILTCNECAPAHPESFDVSSIERFRKQSERVTLLRPKIGLKITLLSIDELTYKLPIHIN